MLHCWDAEPGRRPDFRQLTDIFETMITADVEYLELRSLIVTNRTYFGGNVVPAPHEFRDNNRSNVWIQQDESARSEINSSSSKKYR